MLSRFRRWWMVGLSVTAAWCSAVPSVAALVFQDGFEARPVGANLAGSLPETGAGRWAVEGAGEALVAPDGVGMAVDVRTSYSAGFLALGPALPSERWIRLDLPGEANSNVVVTPQLQTGTEKNVTGLPAVWPARAGSGAWGLVNTTFATGGGGYGQPSQLNLATLYPACDRSIPFRVEIHWKVRADAPNKADMSVRIWNGDQPPDYAPGATAVYTLTSGVWNKSMRSALSRVGTPALVSAVAIYDAAPQSVTLAATSPAISYSGRWETFGGERHASNAGQRFRFLATGDSCVLRFRCEVASFLAISYRVNGGAWTRVTLPAGADVNVPVFTGQTWGPRAVEVVASAVSGSVWTKDVSRLVFRGIRLSPGASAAPLPWPSHKAVFLGDSITNGHLVLSANPGGWANPQSEALLTPASLLADWLGWDTTNISIPGIGFLRPYPSEMTPLIARTYLEQSFQGVPWQPANDVSEVIINLGTNDADGGVYPNNALRDEVAAYLRSVRSLLPSARIYLMRPFNGARAVIIKAAMDDVADANTVWVDTSSAAPGGAWIDLVKANPGDTFTPDTTDTLHPNARGNAKIARRLIPTLGADGAPVARLDWPTDGATVSGRVAVRGSAHGVGFIGAVLGLGEGDAPTGWQRIQDLETPLSGSLLGVWDTRGLPPGRYSLRLVTGADAATAVTTVRVNVVREPGFDGPSLVDAATALKAAAGMMSLPADTAVRLDVAPVPGAGARLTGDGRVTVEDAIRLLRPAGNG